MPVKGALKWGSVHKTRFKCLNHEQIETCFTQPGPIADIELGVFSYIFE